MVGVVKVRLRLYAVQSLKDKRSIVKRLVSRVKNEFGISAAEVEEMDVLNMAVIGAAVVSNNSRLANSILDNVVGFVTDQHLAEVLDWNLEILHV